MRKQLQNFLLAILAGSVIALGVMVYTACENKVAGAVLFSFGLISVFLFGLNLYTGKVGFASKLIDIPNLIIMIVGNAIGAGLACFNARESYIESAQKIVAGKMDYFTMHPLGVLGGAIVCGVIIYLCTLAYKQYKYWQVAIIGVPLFILAGTEHSIADIGFLFAARQFSLQTLFFIIVVILGNAIGAIAVHNIILFTKEKN